MTDETQHIEVGPGEEGLRLDSFLALSMPGLGRAGAREWVKSGDVRVDGHWRAPGKRVHAGEVVETSSAPPLRDFTPTPEPDLPLSVVHEDDALLVVKKPAGMPCHPLRPHERGTLAAALLARYPELERVGPRREVGLVHRLDIGTSGLVVCARTQRALRTLTQSLRQGDWRKHYQAIVSGVPEQGARYEWPLAPAQGDDTRVRVVDESDNVLGAPAITELCAVEPVGSGALVEAQASRASRHQVRVHLAHAGHPLIGDALYGGDLQHELDFHALHANLIELPHPETGQPLLVEAELPAALRELLAAMRA